MYVSMLTSSYTPYNSFIFNISAFDIFILVETFLHSRNAEKFLTACVFRIENLCHLTTLLTNFFTAWGCYLHSWSELASGNGYQMMQVH